MTLSTFTWLDTSEHDRRRALDVIDLFSLQQTRDELGIGVIRDSLADQLSPGTSTIQRRVRYFLFIPWHYQKLEAEAGARPQNVARRLRNAELHLIEGLAESEESTGIIGIESRKALKRFASSIYWNGLWVWGIRIFSGSQERYHASFGRPRAASLDTGPDGEPDRDDWHPHLPDPPDGFPWEATFALTKEEAEYLRDRLRARGSGSLLTFLVDADQLGPRTDFPWEHPFLSEAPPALQELVEHSRCFSEVLHGAALLYNLMLAEKLPHEEWTDEYRELLQGWAAALSSRAPAYASWDRDRFWQQVRHAGRVVPPPTRTFCDAWIDLALEAADPARLLDDARARDLITNRELRLKRNRSRLAHREYLELWSGAAGTAQLDYRWGITQSYVDDILVGLGATLPDEAEE